MSKIKTMRGNDITSQLVISLNNPKTDISPEGNLLKSIHDKFAGNKDYVDSSVFIANYPVDDRTVTNIMIDVDELENAVKALDTLKEVFCTAVDKIKSDLIVKEEI